MTNGGRIGSRNAPGVDGTSGVWSVQEVADAARAGLWTPDPYFGDVSALLRMEGNSGSTVFTDVKGHLFTAFGAAQLIAPGGAFGRSCGLFNGTDAYLESEVSDDFGFGAGDWSVEAWVLPVDSSGSECLFDGRVGGSQGGAIYTSLGGGAGNNFGFTNNAAVLVSGSRLTPATWHHIFVSRSGTTVRGFVNGVLDWQVEDARTYAASTAVRIGASTAGQYLQGRADELRITKGVARHVAAFTPPAVAFPGM